MPSFVLNTELDARVGEFQDLVNKEKLQSSLERKMRATMTGDELFSHQDSRVFVRARPCIAFDGVPLDSASMVQKVSGKRDAVLLTPKVALSGEPSIEASVVSVDGVFIGEHDNNERVYVESCFPLVAFAVDGASTCILCYGQTGSGKTFTTVGIFTFIVEDLTPFFATHDISLTVLELQARRNVDLLTGSDVRVVEDISGELRLLGTSPTSCYDAEHLAQLFHQAAGQRCTRATSRNETSSRTHMIIRVSIVPKETQWAKPGELFVVDLAGSENTADSATHDKERNSETKFINTSLMTLKDCIRARALASSSAKHLHIPFRRSPLTLLLRDCFEISVKRPTKCVMIACVSPLLRDYRHTAGTLRYASMLAVAPPSKVVDVDPNDPNGFTREQALAFLGSVAHGVLTSPEAVLPEGDGRTLVHLPEAEFIRRVMNSHSAIGEKKAKLIYNAVWKRVVDARTKGRKVLTEVKRITQAPRCAQ